ncbi:hypothetical protein ACFVTM_17025 [Arthrobacter sp. NPDC058130]|uniref:hypothetical protein n=1 Tax=Arthrobacter sp. NPDC058130 TaxID=3346353 RepID=UPI0036F0D6D4
MTQVGAVSPTVQFGPAIFCIATLALFGYGVRKEMQRVRDRSQPWTRRLNAISQVLLGLVLCTLFATPMICTMFPDSASWASTTAVLFILCIIAPFLFTVDVMVKFAKAFDHSELVGTKLKLLLALAMSSRLSEVKRASVVLKQRLLPDGFRDLHPSKLMKPLFKSEYRALGMFYLCAGGLGVMSLLTVLVTGQGAPTQIFRTWAVFWVLMVALSMTLPFTLAWVALKYAAATGAIQCRITVRSSLSIVANWVSIGGVIGLLSGSLSLLPLRFMAGRGLGQEPVSLSILADLSLAGAVGGFIAAHFGAIFACTTSMKNRLASLSLPVLAIAAFTTPASLLGMNPAANADYSLAVIRKSVIQPTDLRDLDHLAQADWKTVLTLSEEGMRGAFPGPASFAVAVVAVALVVALLMLGRHVRSSLSTAERENRHRTPQGHLAGGDKLTEEHFVPSEENA